MEEYTGHSSRSRLLLGDLAINQTYMWDDNARTLRSALRMSGIGRGLTVLFRDFLGDSVMVFSCSPDLNFASSLQIMSPRQYV